MAKCDLCGDTHQLADLIDLVSQYQTAHVKSVCPVCAGWADKQLSEIRAGNAPELRRRIEERVKPTTRASFWRRLFNGG